jgi:hypothetical protein
MRASDRLRFGILGAGRSRQGLGPYHARHAEAAGGEVVAIAGRDLARTQATARSLEESLGHSVLACEGVAALLRQDLDALIIAAPPAAHLPALRATLAAEVPVLCEKPLVTPEEHGLVPGLMREFREREILIMETCQWPLVLPALAKLHPERDFRHPREVKMRLSPSPLGRAMVVDSLSHFLSVLQALAPLDGDTRITALEFRGRGGEKDGFDLALELAGENFQVVGELILRQCPEQPRPAWIQVDGARIERQIRLPDYQISLVAGDRKLSVDDPLAGLVYGFVQCVREATSDRVRTESLAIQCRARLYQQIVEALDHYLEA